MIRAFAFLVIQLALVGAAVGAVWRRSAEWEALRRLPATRETPVRVPPLYDDPRVVTDEQVLRVLHKLRPQLRGEKPKINHVDHALRFWGLEATFQDPKCLSGVEMRDLLLNHELFAAAWGDQAQPLLLNRRGGIAVRTQEGHATASHVDHTLGGLAEVGVTLDHPVITPNGPSTVRAMFEQSLRDFSLNQLEYEWSTLAYALYLEPTLTGWLSTEGQQITFDRLAERIMRQKLNQGVCMGNHRLHALVMLLRVDEHTPLLSPEGRQRVIAHLQGATQRLVAHQYEEGYWLRNWPDRQEGETDDESTKDTLANRILATGHALEWWSLAPEEVHPPRETVIRAGQWLARTIEEMDDETIAADYTFLSHAGRALALWRGRFPAEFCHQLPNESPIAPAPDRGQTSDTEKSAAAR
jgi:hypothetical protein